MIVQAGGMEVFGGFDDVVDPALQLCEFLFKSILAMAEAFKLSHCVIDFHFDELRRFILADGVKGFGLMLHLPDLLLELAGFAVAVFFPVAVEAIQYSFHFVGFPLDLFRIIVPAHLVEGAGLALQVVKVYIDLVDLLVHDPAMVRLFEGAFFAKQIGRALGFFVVLDGFLILELFLFLLKKFFQ